MREVADIKDDCQKQLDEALPALRAANKALSSLEKKDIGEVKNYIKPPDAVEKVLNSVLILFGR